MLSAGGAIRTGSVAEYQIPMIQRISRSSVFGSGSTLTSNNASVLETSNVTKLQLC